MTADDLALPLVVRPLHGESAFSFVSRLADVNGIRASDLLFDISGGRSRRPDRCGEAEWERLAARANLPVEALDELATKPTGDQARALTPYLGTKLKWTHLLRERIRLCPKCIAERRMLPAVWRLLHWTACIEHGNYLVEACDCGQRLDYSTRGMDPFTCRCGRPFAEIRTRPASPLALAGARWLMHLIGPRMSAMASKLWLDCEGRPDAPFSPFAAKDPMTLYDALVIIEVIGLAATTPPDDDPPMDPSRLWQEGGFNSRNDLDRCIAHVEAAMSVIGRWPQGWYDVLSQVAGRNAAAGTKEAKHLFATRIGRIVLTPYKGSDGRPCRVLRNETDRWLAERGYTIRDKMPVYHSETAKLLYRVLNLRHAAKRLGITRKRDLALVRIYKEVVDEFDKAADRPTDVQALAEAVFEQVRERYARMDDYRYRPETSMASVPTADYLSNPKGYATAKAWIHPDLLTPINHHRRTIFRRESDVFDRAQVEALRQRIEDAARLVTPDAIPDGFQPYSLAGKRVVEQDYTKTDLILHILSGIVPSVRTGPKPRLCDLYIDVAAARKRALDQRYERMVVQDKHYATSKCQQILEVLWPGQVEKITPEVNKHLVERGQLRVEQRISRTQGREKPYNFYSIRDHMARLHRLAGPCGLPDLDAALGRLNGSADA